MNKNGRSCFVFWQQTTPPRRGSRQNHGGADGGNWKENLQPPVSYAQVTSRDVTQTAAHLGTIWEISSGESRSFSRFLSSSFLWFSVWYIRFVCVFKLICLSKVCLFVQCHYVCSVSFNLLNFILFVVFCLLNVVLFHCQSDSAAVVVFTCLVFSSSLCCCFWSYHDYSQLVIFLCFFFFSTCLRVFAKPSMKKLTYDKYEI